jgi:glyoxylase-like metal-dependent hydrolase (beta-lactamase superfamily II)
MSLTVPARMIRDATQAQSAMTSSASIDGAQPGADVTAEGETLSSRGLRYVALEAPAAGASIALENGMRWARIPLPVDLDHINVWLIDNGEGWIIVDTGMAASIGKDAWESIDRDVFAARPVSGIFVTHMHPDHIGLAAWLQDRFHVPVMMSARTRQIAALLTEPVPPSETARAAAFFRSHGLADFAAVQPIFRPERMSTIVSGMPTVEREIGDGEMLRFGGSEWLAMETNGHAEGHLCLSNAAAHVLISGDQVLPTISSNISYTWRNDDLNPLGSYLSSLERLRKLPADTFVLPSHGRPFRGLRHRIDDLLQHHVEQLDKLVKACVEPKTATELLSVMFRRTLKGIHLFLAFAEVLAHLEYLVHAGRAERVEAAGMVRYRTADS